MTPLSRRSLLHLGLTALPALALPIRIGAQAVRPLTMLLDAGHTGANSWFLLAQDRGYLKQAGIDVTFTVGDGAYTTATRMGADYFDIGYGDVNALIEVVANQRADSPVAVYMMFNSSPSALAVKADGGVQDPRELVGKRVIGRAGDVAFNTFAIYAAEARMQVDDVNIEGSEAGTAAQLAELMSGKADAIVGDVTTITAAATAAKIDPESQLRIFRYEDLVDKLYGSAVMVSRTLATGSPLVVRGLLRAFTHGLKDAIADPDAAIDALVKRDASVDRAIEKARLLGTFKGEMASPEGQRLGIGEVEDGRLAENVIMMVQVKKLVRMPGIYEVFLRDFLPPLPERVTTLGR